MPQVEKEELGKWNDLCDKRVNKAIARRAEKLFTIPGLMTAYIADSIGLYDVRPKPQLFVHCNPSSQEILYRGKDRLTYPSYTRTSPCPSIKLKGVMALTLAWLIGTSAKATKT